MKLVLLIFVLFCSNVTFSQEFRDTLFFKNGTIRPARITKIENNFVHYEFIEKNGALVSTIVQKVRLTKISGDYSVEYVRKMREVRERMKDSKPPMDSILSFRHNLAINPVSLVLLGVNICYLAHFGKEYRHCLYVPFRMSTYFRQIFYADFGVGYAFSLTRNREFDLLCSVVPTFYIADDLSASAIVFSLIGKKNITPRVTLNASIGIGPKIHSSDGTLINVPVLGNASFGIGINLGKWKLINRKFLTEEEYIEKHQ